MSCFAGLYHFDGKPATPGTVAAMGKLIARRGPDGGLDYHEGNLGMAYRAFHTTPESHREIQPLVSSFGEVLCWNGCLDNRAELSVKLLEQTRHVPHWPPADADLVMAAYRKWGNEFLMHLSGDFALVLYDPRERQIILGKDFFGSRSLYYMQSKETLLWSTDLLPLIQYDEAGLALDEHYIAQYLLMSIEPHRTPYLRIHAVEPGHILIFKDGQLKTNEWHWRPDPNKEIRYKADQDYEEHFYALFKESVKNRLRSDRPVWADLSGGLDSSSIVCMADQLIQAGETECPRLDTWTAICGESILTNELPYVRLVEEKRGRRGFHLYEDELWFRDISCFEEPLTVPTALLCVPNRYRRLQNEMNEAGARVLLSGHGGDHLLWKTDEPSPHLADHLLNGNFSQLCRDVNTWSVESGIPYLTVLMRYALLPLMPELFAARLRPEREVLQFLCNRRLAKQYARHPYYPPDPFSYPTQSGRAQSRMLMSAIRFIAPELFPGFFRPEVRYPYLDRRLAEYLFAIPHFQKQRPGESRSLMRRAFRSLLPSEIIHRESKGTIDEAICRALRSAWEAVTLVVNPEFVDQRAFTDAVNDVMYGGKTNRGDTLRLISLQIFLRGKNILGQGDGQPNFALSQGAAFRDFRTGAKPSVAAMPASLPNQLEIPPQP